ncbi:glycosyltransferase family 4 protein [Arhodomonas sp. AD133]|uniref:glycosyltransferase family 4 protein n=1 Tax=Arhodomonas sp. AD133 TaxID=3415009 RepID=UPI003EBF5EDF
MKLLFCNFEYPPLGGGGGVVNAWLAEELATRHDVTVLTSQGFHLPREEKCGGVRILRVPVLFRRQLAAANLPSMFAYMVNGIREGGRLLERESFDVINTHFVLPSGPVGARLAYRFGIPNVVSVHGGDLYDPSKRTSPHRHALLRSWVRRLLRSADHVVGQSQNTLDNMRRFYTPELGGELIPLGIRRPPAAAGNRGDYGFAPDEILLTTVGRLVARKAITQLLTVTAALGNANVRLLVIGDGPQRDELVRRAGELAVADRVHFLGHVDEDEKFRILRMSDVFVSTSQHEGFGLVFLEGMAAGLPVVSYDHGGQTDFLASDRTGYLVALNDETAFLDACRRLVREPALGKHMGQENRARAEAFFIDRCAEQYERVFEAAVTASTRSRRLTIGAGRY